MILYTFVLAKILLKGSDCGSVGRVVTSNSRDPRFKSSHQEIFTVNYIEMTKIKKKRPGLLHF